MKTLSKFFRFLKYLWTDRKGLYERFEAQDRTDLVAQTAAYLSIEEKYKDRNWKKDNSKGRWYETQTKLLNEKKVETNSYPGLPRTNVKKVEVNSYPGLPRTSAQGSNIDSSSSTDSILPAAIIAAAIIASSSESQASSSSSSDSFSAGGGDYSGGGADSSF
jgi:hypothetical protein